MADSLSVVAVVPVRGGSKGLPGKNVMPLHGVPLYLRAVQQGLRVAGRVVVSTDIPEILDNLKVAGCTVLQRSGDLASDDAPMNSVIRDVILRLGLDSETVLLLQATSPLRSDSDISAVLTKFSSGEYDLVMSVTPKDRGILKYGTISDGIFEPVSRPEYCFTNRQSLPQVYAPNGAVYAFKAATFMQAGDIPHQRIGAVEMPIERSVDIDTIDDFRRIELAIAERVTLHASSDKKKENPCD